MKCPRELENFVGFLDSTKYKLALEYLKSLGIGYKDIGYGGDSRYYWCRGLYRITGNTVFLVYVPNLNYPICADCFDCSQCHANFRPRLC